MEEKDYIVHIRIHNGPFKRAMLRAGFETAADLSRKCGVDQQAIGRYLGLKQSPYVLVHRKRKHIAPEYMFAKTIVIIARTLNCSVEDLFPPQHMKTPLQVNTASFDASLDDIRQITADRDPLAQIEQRLFLTQTLATLTAREERVIRLRFGFGVKGRFTLDEIGKEYGVTGQRIREIEARALRKLRHPKRLGNLTESDFFAAAT